MGCDWDESALHGGLSDNKMREVKTVVKALFGPFPHVGKRFRGRFKNDRVFGVNGN